MSTDLHSWIEQLASIDSNHPGGGLVREVYTPEYEQAVEFVSMLMRDVGLDVRLDTVGNLFGLWEGTEPELSRVLTGSHFDTTLNAGRYDGVLGVLGAIDAVRQLRAGGFAPRRGIELIAFAGEEPRFGTGCIGSRAMIGALSHENLDQLADRNGVTVAAAMRSVGLDPDRLTDAIIGPDDYCAQLELHIEQGAVLEHAGVPIGVVEQIAAPHDLRVTLTGVPCHAGSTPISLRRDALTGAAEVVLAVETLARGSASGTTVGTVGVLTVEPGAVNVIPGAVTLDIDIRDSDVDARTAVVNTVLETVDCVAAARGLSAAVETLVVDTPAACAPEIVAAVRASADSLDIPNIPMTSGAYHDSMVLSRTLPVGMIFVPSRDGISHHPDEYIAPEEIDPGVRVLAGALRHLAS